MRIIVGMTGASGAVYGIRLIERLQKANCEIHAVMSPAWKQSAAHEGIAPPKPEKNLRIYEPENYNVPMASGSEHFDGMVIAPCSGSTLACTAAGINRHLIHRAAEVQLKERRRLILLFRESPLSLIHIRNMEQITLAGGIVQMAAPHFYHAPFYQSPHHQSPQTVQDVVDTVITRTLQLLGIDASSSTTSPPPSSNRCAMRRRSSLPNRNPPTT